jgi:Flp pilus assembly protein TadG
MRRILGLRRRAGTASIELALLVPVLAAVLVGMFDWGLAIEQRIRLQTAARAGAQQALRTPADTAAITAAVRAAAPDFQALTISPSPIWCECGTTATACTSACEGGLARFVRVSVSHPFSPITPAGPTSVSANVTLRLQ